MWFFGKRKNREVDLESRRSFLKRSLLVSSVLLSSGKVLSNELVFSDEIIEKNKEFFIKNEDKFLSEIENIIKTTKNYLSNRIETKTTSLIFSVKGYIMFRTNYDQFSINIEDFFKIFKNVKILEINKEVKIQMIESIKKTDLGDTNFSGMYIYPDKIILLKQNKNLSTSSLFWPFLFNEIGHHFYNTCKEEKRVPKDTIEIDEFISDYFTLVFCYYSSAGSLFMNFIEHLKTTQYENYKLSKSILKEVLKEIGIIKKGNANYYIDNNVYFEREEQLEIVSRLKVYFDNFII